MEDPSLFASMFAETSQERIWNKKEIKAAKTNLQSGRELRLNKSVYSERLELRAIYGQRVRKPRLDAKLKAKCLQSS